MKNLISILTCTMIMVVVASAQNVINPASPGFDVIRENIPHGKIDTISYSSKTVGTTRRALIYTPPAIQKKKNIRFYIFCMVSAAMKKNG